MICGNPSAYVYLDLENRAKIHSYPVNKILTPDWLVHNLSIHPLGARPPLGRNSVTLQNLVFPRPYLGIPIFVR